MVSASIDTTAGNLVMGIAFLSSPEGQLIQAKAHAAILAAYPNNEGWEACLHEEKVPYITALVKEVLRYFSVIPICLPRTSVKPMQWNGATISAGTTFYMNAYAANYDAEHFRDPFNFSPERYLGDQDEAGATPHFAFGAGSRMCVGSHLANKELYTVFLRLISTFKILPADDERDKPILDALECSKVLSGLTTDPKEFKVKFQVRDEPLLHAWLEGSARRTETI